MRVVSDFQMLGVVSWIFSSLFSRIYSAEKCPLPRDRKKAIRWLKELSDELSNHACHWGWATFQDMGSLSIWRQTQDTPAGCSWPSYFSGRLSAGRQGGDLICCLRNTTLCSLESCKNLPGCRISGEDRESRGEHCMPLCWTCSSLHKKN